MPFMDFCATIVRVLHVCSFNVVQCRVRIVFMCVFGYNEQITCINPYIMLSKYITLRGGGGGAQYNEFNIMNTVSLCLKK